MGKIDYPTVTVDSAENQTSPNPAIQLREALFVLGEFIILFFVYVYSLCESIYKKLINPDPPVSVKGEIVVITGTGHGIGKELALLYAKEGAIVVNVDINKEQVTNTVKEIELLGYKSHYYICDVSNYDNVIEVAEKIQKEVGDVTILINNAGIMPTRPFLEQTNEEIKRTFDINVMAHFWTLKAFLPTMLKNNHGHIVSLASMAGLIGCVNLVPYCGSKYAVTGIMEALFEELRRRPNNKIQLTNICPYMVDTGLCEKVQITYPSLMPLLSPKFVASEIMDAQRTRQMQISVPRHLQFLINFPKALFPLRASLYIKDRMEAFVYSEKK